MLTKNIHCPRCGKPVLRKILKITGGKCNNCGYLFANPILKFFNNSNIKEPIANMVAQKS